MTIEEKAKRYDDAKERMKDFLKEWENCGAVGEAMEKARNVFSELKEAEDEKILNCIRICLTDANEQRFKDFNTSLKDCLAWLEKQGEKPNNVYDKELSEILGRVIRRYINDPNISYTEREKVSTEIIPYVKRLEAQGEPKKHDVCDNCDQQGSCVSPCPMKLVEKQGEQRTDEWVQELEYKLSNATPEQLAEWKEKYFKVEPAEWSKEEESMICSLEGLVKDTWREAEIKHDSLKVKRMSELSFFLKTLNPSKIHRPAWSEEDEKILKEIISDVKFEGYNNDMQANSYKKINWLKFLKDRYTWKPSKKQLEALESTTENCAYSEYQDCLLELIGQLKKLIC